MRFHVRWKLRYVTVRVVSVVVGLFLINMMIIVNQEQYPETSNLDVSPEIPTFRATFRDEEPFEPEVLTDFPGEFFAEPKIPRIIHQMFKTQHIPTAFESFVRSFSVHNPDWTYFFWTDETARRFLKERYPNLLTMWKNYGRDINRADALRYIILYEYGGLYADLDVENFRPLHKVTTKYSCIIPPDSFEHSAIAYNLPYLLSNAVMFCRAKHPFMKQIVDRLTQFQPLAEEVDSTGNSFLTSQFVFYNKMSPDDMLRHTVYANSTAPYIFRGYMPEEHPDAVFIPNTAYFMSSLESKATSLQDYKRICSNVESLKSFAERGCAMLERRSYTDLKHIYTFTKHYRKQAYISPHWFLNTTVSVTNVVPHITSY